MQTLPETEVKKRSYVYRGSLLHFDGLLDRLRILEGTWHKFCGVKFNVISRRLFEKKLAVGLLRVAREGEENQVYVAAMEAFEFRGGRTQVDFTDGRQPFYVRTMSDMLPIGAAFEGFNQWVVESGELQPIESVQSLAKERGPKVGTLDRVREAHRLHTEGDMPLTVACKEAKVDSRTYYQWCEEATGEEPKVPYVDT